MTTVVFFFNDTATTEIYTLSLHDALPIYAQPAAPGLAEHHAGRARAPRPPAGHDRQAGEPAVRARAAPRRSEEHTSELQSRQYLVCRLLLEKKKTTLYLLIIPPLPPSLLL